MTGLIEHPPFYSGRSCTQCGLWKHWSEFDKKPNGKNGHDSRCKICISNAKKVRKIKKQRRFSEAEKLSARIVGAPDDHQVQAFSKIIAASIMQLMDKGVLK